MTIRMNFAPNERVKSITVDAHSLSSAPPHVQFFGKLYALRDVRDSVAYYASVPQPYAITLHNFSFVNDKRCSPTQHTGAETS